MVKKYKIDDGWYKSENLRLNMIGSSERWVKDEEGEWYRSNKANTGFCRDGIDNVLVMTDHFLERLEERSGLGIKELIKILRQFDLKMITKVEKDKRILEFNHDGSNYIISIRDSIYGDDVLILSTIIHKEDLDNL